jgi:hypothetical protein
MGWWSGLVGLLIDKLIDKLMKRLMDWGSVCVRGC